MRSFARSTLVALAVWTLLAVTWELSRYSASKTLLLRQDEKVRLSDLGGLQQYRQTDMALKRDPDRVVFLGDSITYMWDLAEAFPGAHYVNRGIMGQASGDMLVRFRQDVVGLQPKAVVILAGVNDFILRDPGSVSEQQTLANLESNDQTMAELAELHGIHPVFISMLPLHDYTAQARRVYRRVSPSTIVAANDWLRSFCAEHGYPYIDVYTALLDQHGRLQRQLSDDGVHPNSAGYRMITEIVSNRLNNELRAISP